MTGRLDPVSRCPFHRRNADGRAEVVPTQERGQRSVREGARGTALWRSARRPAHFELTDPEPGTVSRMARPKEFDEHTAIERAMEAFWTSGYEGTSTQALCDATGLGRSRIYNTFTSKRELFLRAFDQYSERGFQGRIAVLEADRPAIERFRDLFASTIDDEIAQGRRGCLVVNTVAEFGERDPEIRARINADTRRHLRLLPR